MQKLFDKVEKCDCRMRSVRDKLAICAYDLFHSTLLFTFVGNFFEDLVYHLQERPSSFFEFFVGRRNVV